MAKYLVRASVPYVVLQKFQLAIEDICESIMVFEDPGSPPANAYDANGFAIASLFQIDMLCDRVDVALCKAHAESATALLGIDAAIKVEEVEKTNWLLACHSTQPEVRIHPFVIHSSTANIALKPGEISLKIDAATAFGSGEHASTQGCLKLFTKLALKQKFAMVLDMGCGSGILSIAAKKLQPTMRVVGVDIEAEAVRRTRLNTKMNACEQNYQVICSVGFQNPGTRQIYDLCFANILAKPLIRLAPAMQRYLKSQGYIIVSGLLDRQASMVCQAYKLCGFGVTDYVSIQGWQSIVFKKLS